MVPPGFCKRQVFKFYINTKLRTEGAVSKLNGAYIDVDGESKRALFVIDDQGIVQCHYLSPDGIKSGTDGILDAEELSHSK